MTTQIVLLILCCFVMASLIVFRKTAFVKKYWRYALILAPGILVLIIKILTTIRQNSSNSSGLSSNDKEPTLKDEITTIKERLEEVNTTVKVEAAIAKTKNEEMIKELEEVQKIPDQRERNRRLAEMVG